MYRPSSVIPSVLRRLQAARQPHDPPDGLAANGCGGKPWHQVADRPVDVTGGVIGVATKRACPGIERGSDEANLLRVGDSARQLIHV